MSDGVFTLEIVTPRGRAARQVRSVRLRDGSGSFGIMRGHLDLLAVLPPSLGYYLGSDGRERFIAVDGGICRVRRGSVTITSREVFESDDPAALAALIDTTLARRDAADLAVARMIERLERSFLEKNAAIARGRG